MSIFPNIRSTVEQLNSSEIPLERKSVLLPLVEYLRDKRKQSQPIALNFICTHNSRRSHLCQIWAQTMAHLHGWHEVVTYSAGTSATALFPTVLEVLKNDGFEIERLSEGNNPIYALRFSQEAEPIVAFSKSMDHPFNPSALFCAIMTCSEADGDCPFVPGAEKRIPITYIDPKVADGSDEQMAVYLERSRQIATEMAFIFHSASSC